MELGSNNSYFSHRIIKQLSADIECTIIRLKPVLNPEVPKAPAKKTGLNLMIVHFYIRRKLDIIRC